MTRPPTNLSFSKSKGLVVLEYILFAICLGVIALRCTITEGPTVQSSTVPGNLADNIYTLTISAILIFSFVLWFICSLCGDKFLYRFTGVEIGLGLFCMAAIIAGLAAPNKRLAISSFVTLLAPVAMAVLLAQILDSYSKIKLLLCVIAALAVVCSYQSAEQFFFSNQMTIDQYEQAPQTMLEPLGIKPGTFAHFLFEHRLYTRGVRGFFTTRNSAGSFALMACFVTVALFIEKFKTLPRRTGKTQPHCKVQTQNAGLSLIPCGIALAAILFALIVTRSKGAIIGSVFAAIIFITLLRFSNWIRTYKKTIFAAGLLLFILGCCMAGWYGLNQGQPPGGSSMLVRWQYWLASAKMYADHPLTGVGPANFAHFYPHYKPAAALEAVADPHNFLLSILTQYGPLGLIGFLAMIFIPLWRLISTSIHRREARCGKSSSPQAHPHQPAFRNLALAYLAIISIVLLLIRPAIIRTALAGAPGVQIYVIFTLYLAPVAAFFLGFLLLISNQKKQTFHTIRNTKVTAAALLCALLGLMLHNLIDFAIFEPPVLTTFWAVIAALCALTARQNPRPKTALRPKPATRILAVAAALTIIWAYCNYAFIPVARSTTKMLQAYRAVSNGYLQKAHGLLTAAAEDDRLDPTALILNGRLYLQQYQDTKKHYPPLLKKAEQCFLQAIARDRADFKNYDKLCTIYGLLGQTQKAYQWGIKTAKRYPGSARLQFKLAEISQKLNKTNAAINHYKKAIDIENRFRQQFSTMYPNHKIVSRLGKEKYNRAKQRLQSLIKKSPP